MSFWDNHGGIELSKVRADYSIQIPRDNHRPLIQTLSDRHLPILIPLAQIGNGPELSPLRARRRKSNQS